MSFLLYFIIGLLLIIFMPIIHIHFVMIIGIANKCIEHIKNFIKSNNNFYKIQM